MRESRRQQDKRRQAKLSARAAAAHQQLIRELGGRCARCEATEDEAKLTVDHVDVEFGYQERLHKRSWPYRVLYYLKEYEQGVQLRVLCHQCNSVDGARRWIEHKELLDGLEEAPF